MSRSSLSKLFLIIVVSLTLILCLVIPEIPIRLKESLFIAYSFLLVLSLIAKPVKIALLLLICACALPIAEILWWIYYLGVDEMSRAVYDHELVFSFIGKISYVIVMLITPGAVFLLGEVIRTHRKSKSLQTT